VASLAKRIKDDTESKKYAFLPIGVEGANMEILNSIAGFVNGKIMEPMILKGANFKAFFQWLSASIGTIVQTGNSHQLNSDGSKWMNVFENGGFDIE